MLIVEEWSFYALASGVVVLLVVGLWRHRFDEFSRLTLSLISSVIYLCGFFADRAGDLEGQLWLLAVAGQAIFVCYKIIHRERLARRTGTDTLPAPSEPITTLC